MIKALEAYEKKYMTHRERYYQFDEEYKALSQQHQQKKAELENLATQLNDAETYQEAGQIRDKLIELDEELTTIVNQSKQLREEYESTLKFFEINFTGGDE